ncbi:dihydrofolate reductase [Clostridium sp.]|uniref:dihydrofolate reductase n=1 Tax=Clostridium sp. TaxID=1506 RepID=UPI000945E0D5|nr:dihydrofolate reductase [Clostridium sp.]APO27270.1 Dihydrofolate reductase [uncultured bacterium]
MISLIVAMDKNNGIGNKNKLLAHISEDLRYFKRITDGNTIVMGYNTYMSLPKRPLPNRRNIVLTTKDIKLDGAEVVNSIEELLKLLNTEEETFICGGDSIYKQMLPYADKLYITHIFDEFEADTYFPEITDEWEISESICHKENINHKHPHVFTIYTKNSNK